MIAFLFQNSAGDLDACSPKNVSRGAAVSGVGVLRAINHPFEMVFQNGFRTGWRFSGGAARLQSNVQSGIRKQGGVASGRSIGNSLPFRMGQAGFFMKTGADHLVFMHDDRSHAGIRTCQPDPFFGQFYGHVHPARILILRVHADLVARMREKGQSRCVIEEY